MRGRISRLQGEEGFSLPELMIAVIVLSVIVFAAFQLLEVHLKEGSVVAMKADLGHELRETSDVMIEQLRTARDFDSAGYESVTFTGYITGTNQLYYVRFRLQDGQVMYYSDITPPPETDPDEKVLAQDVAAMKLTFYDVAGSKLNDPDGSPVDVPAEGLEAITKAEIKLTISLTSGDTTLTDTATTSVRIRR